MKIHQLYFLGILMSSCFLGCNNQTEAERLNRQALRYLNRDVDSLALFAQKATDISTNKDDLLTSHTILAMAAFKRQKFDSGYHLMRKLKPSLIASENYEFAAYANIYLGTYYWFKNQMDSAIILHEESLQLLENVDNQPLLSDTYGTLAQLYYSAGSFEQSLDMYQKCLALIKKNEGRNKERSVTALTGLSSVYLKLENGEQALKWGLKAEEMANEIRSKYFITTTYEVISEAYSFLNKPDSALYYSEILIEKLERVPSHKAFYSNFAGVQAFKLGKYELSLYHLKEARKFSELLESSDNSNYLLNLAKTFNAIGNRDSSFFYAEKATKLYRQNGKKTQLLPTLKLLSQLFLKNDFPDSAFKYLNEMNLLQKELFNDEMTEQFAKLNVEIATLEKEKELQIAKNEKIDAQNQLTQIIAVSGFGFLLCLLLFIGYRQKNLANQLKLEREKKSLASELEQNKQMLSTQTLNMIHKNNGFTEIAENLKNGNGQSSTKIKRIIDMNMALEKDWENFNVYFSQVHGDFYGKLKDRHPTLSITESRLCSMVKMGLKNKEMATILNIEYSSITMAKYRLKKKFQLEEKEDLNNYIEAL